MAKIKAGATEVARVIYVNETFGDVFESSDSQSLQAYSFQTDNFELGDSQFGVLDSMDYRGALQGVSNAETAGAANGTRWIVGAIPSGAFSTFSAKQIVRSNGITWIVEPNPHEGTLAYRKDLNRLYYFTNDTFSSGTWEPINISGLQDYRDSVISNVILTPPGSPADGARYLIGQPGDTATGAWAGHAGDIAYWSAGAGAWQFEGHPDMGTMVYVESNGSAYVFNNNTFASGTWVVFSTGVYTSGNGISISGNAIAAKLLTNGGLKFVGTAIGVEPNDFAGAGLIDNGSDKLAIDWASTLTIDGADAKAIKASDLASTSSGKGASAIGVQDSNSYFTGTSVESVLNELHDLASQGTAITYLAGTTLAKGDLVYVSSANTVSKLSDITQSHRAIGLAMNAASVGQNVRVAKMDSVVTGALSGASADAAYYWTGSALTTTMPSTSGAYVWRVGYSKNATDIIASVEYVKKNK